MTGISTITGRSNGREATASSYRLVPNRRIGRFIAAVIQRYAWNRQHEAQKLDWEHQNEIQKKDWEHQYTVQKRDEERQQALKTFEDISTLLDKRLYRMWRLHWAIRNKARGASNEKEMDLARTAYRDVLHEWNDNLNRTLALAQTYFGDGLRQTLEGSLYEAVAALGRALDATEQMVSKAENKQVDIPRLSGRLTRLSRSIYEMNVHMLSLLEKNRRDARLEARIKPSLPVTERMLEIGDQGGAVWYLQRALSRTGQVDINVDGLFGPDTWSAVRVFQSSHNLDADGIVGPKTWAALPLEEPTLQMGKRESMSAAYSKRSIAQALWLLASTESLVRTRCRPCVRSKAHTTSTPMASSDQRPGRRFPRGLDRGERGPARPANPIPGHEGPDRQRHLRPTSTGTLSQAEAGAMRSRKGPGPRLVHIPSESSGSQRSPSVRRWCRSHVQSCSNKPACRTLIRMRSLSSRASLRTPFQSRVR